MTMDAASASPLRNRIWPFVAIVMLQVLLASGSIYVLSAVRAFVAGESQWSKAQKDAIHRLDHYIVTGDRQSYDRFREALQIPQADQEARELLETPDPDMDKVFDAVVRGGNHPEDAGALVWMLRNFQHHALLEEPLNHWRVGDRYLHDLAVLAEEVRDRHENGNEPDAPSVQRWQRALQDIDAGASPAASDFSEAMGRSSRRIVAWLLWLNGTTALVLVALALWQRRRVRLHRRRSADALAEERARGDATLAAVADPLLRVDAQGRIEAANPAAERLLGRTAPALQGQAVEALLAFAPEAGVPDAEPVTRQWLARLLHGAPFPGADRIHHLYPPAGPPLPVRLGGGPLLRDGVSTGAVLTLHDSRREEQASQQLDWHATHDALTGLLHRQAFIAEMAAVLEQHRAANAAGGLLHLHLDALKAVNEAHGHMAGDELLASAARVLQAEPNTQALPARLGGAEFAVLLPGSRTAVQEAAERLGTALRNMEVPWHTDRLRTTASIGMAYLTADVVTVEEALEAARQACSAVRRQGGDGVGPLITTGKPHSPGPRPA